MSYGNELSQTLSAILFRQNQVAIAYLDALYRPCPVLERLLC